MITDTPTMTPDTAPRHPRRRATAYGRRAVAPTLRAWVDDPATFRPPWADDSSALVVSRAGKTVAPFALAGYLAADLEALGFAYGSGSWWRHGERLPRNGTRTVLSAVLDVLRDALAALQDEHGNPLGATEDAAVERLRDSSAVLRSARHRAEAMIPEAPARDCDAATRSTYCAAYQLGSERYWNLTDRAEELRRAAELFDNVRPLPVVTMDDLYVLESTRGWLQVADARAASLIRWLATLVPEPAPLSSAAPDVADALAWLRREVDVGARPKLSDVRAAYRRAVTPGRLDVNGTGAGSLVGELVAAGLARVVTVRGIKRLAPVVAA